MKKILAVFLLLLFISPAFAEYVNGYYRSDGTYVNGYNRTQADYTRLNNYSTRGNVNPYTGQSGTVNTFPTYRNSNSVPYGARNGSGLARQTGGY